MADAHQPHSAAAQLRPSARCGRGPPGAHGGCAPACASGGRASCRRRARPPSALPPAWFTSSTPASVQARVPRVVAGAGAADHQQPRQPGQELRSTWNGRGSSSREAMPSRLAAGERRSTPSSGWSSGMRTTSSRAPSLRCRGTTGAAPARGIRGGGARGLGQPFFPAARTCRPRPRPASAVARCGTRPRCRRRQPAVVRRTSAPTASIPEGCATRISSPPPPPRGQRADAALDAAGDGEGHGTGHRHGRCGRPIDSIRTVMSCPRGPAPGRPGSGPRAARHARRAVARPTASGVAARPIATPPAGGCGPAAPSGRRRPRSPPAFRRRSGRGRLRRRRPPGWPHPPAWRAATEAAISSTSTTCPVGSSARGLRAAGREEIEPDARAGAGHAGDGEVAPHLRAAVPHREAGVDELARVDLVDAHQRPRRPRRGTSPSSTAKGPTAAERLPQLSLPIHHRPVHRDLGEGVVHIRVRMGRRADDDAPWTARKCRRPCRRAAARTGPGCRAPRAGCGPPPRAPQAGPARGRTRPWRSRRA